VEAVRGQALKEQLRTVFVSKSQSELISNGIGHHYYEIGEEAGQGFAG
jgi:hypothetical protein